MRVLVTGAGGFVGTALVDHLLAAGWDVVGTVRPGTPPLANGAETLPVDLADRGAVTRATATASAPAAAVEVAFLLAAARRQSTPAERDTTVAVNATSVQWLVDALPATCRTVVRLGSSTEYAARDGRMDENTPLCPRGFFGATKAAGSLLLPAACAATGRRGVVLRAFQVYGPGDHPDRFVPRAVDAARTGATLPLTEPGMRRDWVFVDDVVEACVRAATADDLPNGQVLNIGTGRQTANEELVATLERVTGRTIRIERGAHPGRSWDTGSWVSDPSRARRIIGWEAKVDLEEGLRRCW